MPAGIFILFTVIAITTIFTVVNWLVPASKLIEAYVNFTKQSLI